MSIHSLTRRILVKKKDIQALYKQAKRRPRGQSAKQVQKSGCKSCGKVTWKPSTQD